MDERTDERRILKNPYQNLNFELKEEYGMSPIEAKALVKKIQEFVETMTIGKRKNNQIIRTVVAIGEPAGKKIRECKLIPVYLSMQFWGEDKIARSKGIRYLKALKVHQLAWECYEQDGLLSYEDLEDILGISGSTIKRIIKRYQQQGITIPTRGQIEDIGPGITHKERIIELLVKGYLYSEVMVLTAHTEASIENYEQKFVRIAYLHQAGKNALKIRIITGYSEALINSFIQLYEKYNKSHPEAVNRMLERFQRYLEDNSEKKMGEHMRNTCKNDNRQKYVSTGKLTYKTKLKQLLKEELGYQGKPKVLELFANEIEKITSECYASVETVGLGQIRMLVPNINDKPSWGQTIENTSLVPVVLTLVTQEDNDSYQNNEKSAVTLQKRISRIADEAINQGGVLTTTIVAQLFGVTQSTVSKYMSAYYEREGKIIPLRGVVHDIGRTTTHKRWIIELYLKGYPTNEIRKMTDHKILSVDRYISRYNSVTEAIEELKTSDVVKISRLLGITQSSAREYIGIYKEYKETGEINRLDYYSRINERTAEMLKRN
jgi:transposase